MKVKTEAQRKLTNIIEKPTNESVVFSQSSSSSLGDGKKSGKAATKDKGAP